MEIFGYILWGVLGLIGVYLLFRLGSMAVLKSWTDVKKRNKERGEDDGDNRSAG